MQFEKLQEKTQSLEARWLKLEDLLNKE